MDISSKRVVEIARPVVGALQTLARVEGIVCFGSFAAGRADESSDVDLYVFCQPKLVDKRSRRRRFQSLSGLSDLQIDYTFPGHDRQCWPQQDKFRLNGLWFDLAYGRMSWIATVVGKVKQGSRSIPELRFRAYTMLGLLENATILFDRRGTLRRLIAGLYPYPETLARELIDRSTRDLSYALKELTDAAVRRIGATSFHFWLARVIEPLSTLVFAMNRKYDPASKRFEADTARLELLPRDFVGRYRRLLTGPFDEPGQVRTAEQLQRLVAETTDLAGRAIRRVRPRS